MTADSTEILSSLVAKRRKCLEQLRDLGLKQAPLIAAGENADLLRLLAAKQQLLAALQGIERQLTPFRGDDPDERRWSSEAARRRCADDAAACQSLLRELVAMEESDQRDLALRRDETAGQIRSLASAGKVRDAYLANRGRGD
jgi:hypothetical protein